MTKEWFLNKWLFYIDTDLSENFEQDVNDLVAQWEENLYAVTLGDNFQGG